LTIKAVDEELARLSVARKSLEARIADAQSVYESNRLQLDLDRIRGRREAARRQSLLPIRQPAFLALLTASLLMLIVLPLSIQWFSGRRTTGDDRRTISDSVCAACGNAPLRSR
jgi:hypothetical protein